jgi:hypothetical protein
MSNSTLVQVTSADPAYTGYLGELRDAGTRAEAARLTAYLSSVADDLSAALLDIGPVDSADEDTSCDPLAWAEVATQLLRVSLALSVGTLDTADWDDDGDKDDWKRLSDSHTRAAFTAAWLPVKEKLTARAARGELRKFAVTQILAVAGAVIGAGW